jgi:hypothetical protein
MRPAFSWAPSSDPDPGDEMLRYRLYIGTHEDSMICVYDGEDTAYRMTYDLIENEAYSWYVESVDRMLSSTRSGEARRRLFINTENEPPQAPVQIRPNHNSYQTTRYPYLEWTAANDPDPGDQIRYSVKYWNSENTSVKVINTTRTYYDSRRFDDMREYFWTVEAIDQSDSCAYSDTLVFYTNTLLDVVDVPDVFSLGQTLSIRVRSCFSDFPRRTGWN